MKNDIYKMVTDRILETIEQGVLPWRKPWVCNGEPLCVNYVSRKQYSLLNCFLLGKPGEYISRKQLFGLGGTLKANAKVRFCVFYSQYEFVQTDNDGEEHKHRVPILRYYNVYHIEDVEGINSKIPAAAGFDHTEDFDDNCERADWAISEYGMYRGVQICEDGSNQAYYSPSRDEIHLPNRDQFQNIAEFFSTAFHECVHSTGAENRLNRKEVTDHNRFGSEPYGREELTAEIGSAMLMQHFDINNEAAFNNSAAYLKGWIDLIKTDNKAIVFASIRAEKAVKYFLFQDGNQ